MKLSPVSFGALFIIAAASWPGTASANPTSEEHADRLTQTALSMDAHPEKGKGLFRQNCSQCHGSDGRGNGDSGDPALAGQRFAYLIRQMANFGSAERDNAAMNHIISDRQLADPQAWSDLAAYLNRLPFAPTIRTGSGLKVALGGAMFHEQCASCHQADASGDKVGFVPSLRNQHFAYLDRQLHQLAAGHRHNVDPSLVLFMRSFDEGDMSALADFLSRQRGPGKSHQHMLDNGVVVN
jgi:cytochrome c553